VRFIFHDSLFSAVKLCKISNDQSTFWYQKNVLIDYTLYSTRLIHFTFFYQLKIKCNNTKWNEQASFVSSDLDAVADAVKKSGKVSAVLYCSRQR
jgi:hypothetical protein